MDHRPKCKTQNYKLLEGDKGENPGELRFVNNFLGTTKSIIEKKLIKLEFSMKNLYSMKDR